MVYLDNAATTIPRPEVVVAVRLAMEETFGNPSSLHALGAEASKLIQEARGTIAGSIGAKPAELIFTSGGTEGNNLAVRGAALAGRGKHLITTEIEHPSVYQVFQNLEDEGFCVEYLGVDAQGMVNPADVARALREDTTLVSVMLVNNEVGSIQPIREIRKAIGKVTLHVDAVQALGKIPVNVKTLGADLMTFSGHKLHGPKGVGALYKAPKVRLKPLLVGGEQEGKLRSGTENVPGIVGFGVAVGLALSEMCEATERMEGLRRHLAQRILQEVPGSRLNGSLEGGSPHIINFSFPSVPGETLLHHLEARKVMVSTRSACSSRRRTPNRVLRALGLSEAEAEGALRFGLSGFTTMAEVNEAADAVRESVEAIRSL